MIARLDSQTDSIPSTQSVREENKEVPKVESVSLEESVWNQLTQLKKLRLLQNHCNQLLREVIVEDIVSGCLARIHRWKGLFLIL